MLETDGRRGDDLSVAIRSSSSTFVELFHAGLLLLSVEFACADASSRSSFLEEGDDSGVRLCVCLCDGVKGVGGWLPMKLSIDDRCRSVRAGSEDGMRDEVLSATTGVVGAGDFVERVSFRASLRNGEMDRDNVFVLGERSFMGVGPMDGDVSKPFFVLDFDFDVVPDVLDPASLNASPPMYIRCTASISLSVRAIRSLRFRQRCVDSACLRRHSPFFVTRSWTPLSMIDRTLVVAGI